MNFERGIWRLYVVTALVWLTWGLYRVVPEQRQRAITMLNAADARMGECYHQKSAAELAGMGTADLDDRCGTEYSREAGIANRMQGQSVFAIYRANVMSVARDCLELPLEARFS